MVWSSSMGDGIGREKDKQQEGMTGEQVKERVALIKASIVCFSTVNLVLWAVRNRGLEKTLEDLRDATSPATPPPAVESEGVWLGMLDAVKAAATAYRDSSKGKRA